MLHVHALYTRTLHILIITQLFHEYESVQFDRGIPIHCFFFFHRKIKKHCILTVQTDLGINTFLTLSIFGVVI